SSIHGLEQGLAPEVDLEEEKSQQEACLEVIKTGIILSAHDCSEGGLAVALVEAALNPTGSVGIDVDLGSTSGLRPDELLFAETYGRIVVSIRDKDFAALEGICASRGVPLAVIGRTVESGFTIKGLIETPLQTLEKAYRDSLKGLIEDGGGDA
ncbi:MAG: AIR synthase-related protein, partial [Thermodesulfobacteriota bacterium]